MGAPQPRTSERARFPSVRASQRTSANPFDRTSPSDSTSPSGFRYFPPTLTLPEALPEALPEELPDELPLLAPASCPPSAVSE